jgi:hypothetical protein
MSTLDESTERINQRAEEHLKKFTSGEAKYNLSTQTSAAAAQPYLVFVVNTTGENLNGTIFYGETTTNQILEVGHGVPDGAQTAFQLGGPGDCGIVTAYRLLLDDGTQYVGDTGPVAAHQNPATPCVDIWGIGQ